MKLLVLSCSTGEGHNSAARALMEEFDRRGVEYVFSDPLQIHSEDTRRRFTDLYNNMIKHIPALFGVVYTLGEIYSNLKLPSPIYGACKLLAEDVAKTINEGGFDGVVSTHLWGMEVMTAITRMGLSSVPMYGVLTDYTTIPFLRDTKLDAYFVGHEEVAPELIHVGIEEDKIYPTGIPTAQRFSNKTTREEAREQLGIAKEQSMVLIMCGGVGCNSVYSLVKKAKKHMTDSAIYVMTGKNEKLFHKIERKFAGTNVHAVPFTTQGELYLKAANVVMTKAGGLSTTEAMIALVPIVHIKSIPGLETKNAKFFQRLGCSCWARSNRQAVKYTQQLIHQQSLSNAMQASQRTLPQRAAYCIAERIIGGAV